MDKEYAQMRLSGILALIHKFVMLVTLPFRKFWKTVFVLLAIAAVIIIVPLCYGVKFYDIWPWYKEKIPFHQVERVKNKTMSVVQEQIDNVKEKVGIASDKEEQSATDRKYAVWNVKAFNQGRPKLADFPPQAGQRIVVKETKTTPQDTDSATQNEVKPKVEPEYHPYVKKSEKKTETVAEEKPQPKAVDGYYDVVDNKQLEYLKTPEFYAGTATIVGSNSLYVSDRFMYLYGIYSDPQIHDLVQAQEYLVQLTEGKNIECYVVAYTVQTQAATSLCFAGDVLLNKALVDKYLADNIALK